MNKIFKLFCVAMLICGFTTALTSCSDDNAPTYLDEVKVSSSYLAFPAEGGSVTVDINAKADWAVVDLPEWLTASSMTGAQGQSQVTFTAGAAEDTREASFKIECLGKAQTMNAIQVTEAAEPVILTVKEVVDMIKADQTIDKSVYVRGIVCKIQEISPQYGNATFFISDDGSFKGSYDGKGQGDGNWLEVYRCKWLNGESFTKGDELAVGDEVVIAGSIMSYGGTPETKQGAAYVYSVTKSLIGIDGVEMLGVEEGAGVTQFPLEGGSAKVTVNSKGNGFHVVIPDEAKSWLHIEDFGPDYVTLHADANTGGDRTVTVGFYTEADGTRYACEQGFSQKGAIVAATVEEFLAAEVGLTQYRLEGIITRLYYYKESVSGFYIADYTGETLVYKAEGFTGTEAKPGDVVKVVGQRGDYKGAAQLVSGTFEEVLYVVNIVNNISDFLSKPVEKGVYYMVTGTIKEIANAAYGNMTIEDENEEVYVYGCYPGWGAKKIGDVDYRKGLVDKLGLKAGDKVTIIGERGSHNEQDQLANGIYFSHEAAE